MNSLMPLDTPALAYNGWYILLMRDKVVYVGSSMHVGARVRSHIVSGEKIFDHVLCAPAETTADALSAERTIYAAIKPRYNKRPVFSSLPVGSERITSGGIMSKEQRWGRRKMVAVSQATYEALQRAAKRYSQNAGVRVSMGEAVALAVNGGAK